MSFLARILGQKSIESNEYQVEIEAQLMTLNESALVSETDIRGNITYVNDTFCTTAKYTREELIGKNHRILKSGLNDEAIYKELWETISSGKVWKGILSNRAKDGSIYWVKSVIIPVLDKQGVPIKYISARVDISQLKEHEQEIQQKTEELLATEEELRQNMEELGAMQEHLQVINLEQEARLNLINRGTAYIEFDLNGNVLKANENFAVIMGYTSTELMGKKHIDFLRSEDRATVFEEHWAKLRKGELIEGEFERVAKNGEIRYLRALYAPIKNKNNEVERVIKIAFDNTEVRKQNHRLMEREEELLAAEEELRQNMEELGAMQEHLQVINLEQEARLNLINRGTAYIEFDLNGNVLKANENFAVIMGYTSTELMGKKHIDFLCSEDRATVFEEHWAKLRNGELIEGEFERVAKNGEIRYLRALYAPVKNKNNEVERVIKIAFDNTEVRKQSSQSIEKEKKLRQLALVATKTDNSVIIMDAKGLVEWVNPAFMALSGYSLEEVVGKQASLFMQNSSENNANSYTDIAQKLKSKQTLHTEFLNKAKNGKMYWVSATITPILDDLGEVNQFVSVQSDITSEKEKILESSIKNKEIQDSINYAQRIQKALLSTSVQLKDYVQNSFLLEKPKDKLSGDFSWFAESEGYLYAAVADCTGHGVPGALVSVLGITVLTQVFKEMPSAKPSEILSQLSHQLQAILSQNHTEKIQDGMDIALIRFNPKTKELVFSGAHRNIFVVQNHILEVLEGDRKNVGVEIIEHSSVNFTDHTLTCQNGDRIYLFSDGITDQFGGKDNKKITPKKFMFFLKTIQDQAMSKQKKEIEHFVQQWRNELEQTDDITVLGLEI